MSEATETLHGHDGVVAAFRDWFDAFEEFSIRPRTSSFTAIASS